MQARSSKRSHDKYTGNGFQLYKSTLFSYERDPMMSLLAKVHALERKESFYAKIKVSTFVNFEVDS